jgi:Glycosyl transferase family 1
MVVVFYISGHGLGHATRQIEVMHALVAAQTDVRIVVRTSAPGWIFERTAPPSIERQHADVDTGIVQIDSLRVDEEATAREAARFYRDFDRLADAEARLLDDLGADLVVGDVPPLAFAAADRAALPSIAIANFTWDWIYRAYDAVGRTAPHVVPTMERAYAATRLALRLPLHGGFDPMRAVTRDIPFIARRSTRDARETRQLLGIRSGKPAVMASFGGHVVDVPSNALRRSDRFTLVDADAAALDAHQLRYQDVVAAVDVVVSKPGYGIVSECAANDTALLYTSRGRFIEYDVFVAEMPRVVRCRFLAQPDFVVGDWADAIDALLRQPPPSPPRTDGARIAVQALLETCEAAAKTR